MPSSRQAANVENMEELTEEQSDILQMFKDVTKEQDNTKCVKTLDVYNWDIESAINGFMEGGHASDTLLSANDAAEDTSGSVGYGDEERLYSAARSNDRQILPSRETGLLGRAATTLLLPIRLVLKTALFPLSMGFRLASMASRNLLSLLGGQGITSYITGAIWSAQAARKPELAKDFAKRFRFKYGNVHIPMLQNTFSEAMQKAKQELKPLLVYIHKDDDIIADTFARDVLCNETFVNSVTENFLVWSAAEGSIEGHEVAETVLHQARFPVLVAGLTVHDEFEVLGKVTGGTLGQTMAMVGNASVTANHFLGELRHERDVRLCAQQLRTEQDLEFEKSLSKDREKESLRQQEQCEREQRERQELQKQQDKQNAKAELRQHRLQEASLVPAEPSNTEEHIARILVKLPVGESIQRRFRESDTVQDIYRFVSGHPKAIDALPATFQLSAHFPKRVMVNPTRTLHEAGLAPSAALYVEEAAEDDNDGMNLAR